jgi:hypothetical protein
MVVSFENRLKSSAISGVLEIIATHPMDYGKTLLQTDKGKVKVTLKQFLMHPYKGFVSRIIGIGNINHFLLNLLITIPLLTFY